MVKQTLSIKVSNITSNSKNNIHERLPSLKKRAFTAYKQIVEFVNSDITIAIFTNTLLSWYINVSFLFNENLCAEVLI